MLIAVYAMLQMRCCRWGVQKPRRVTLQRGARSTCNYNLVTVIIVGILIRS
jgi:hypothetical protein